MGWKNYYITICLMFDRKTCCFSKCFYFVSSFWGGFMHAMSMHSAGKTLKKLVAANDFFLLSNNKPVRSTWLTQIISITLLVIIAKYTLFRLVNSYSKSKITMIIIKSLYSLFITVTTANWNIFCHEHVLTCLRSCHKLGILLFYVCEFCKDLFPQCCLKSSWYSF